MELEIGHDQAERLERRRTVWRAMIAQWSPEFAHSIDDDSVTLLMKAGFATVSSLLQLTPELMEELGVDGANVQKFRAALDRQGVWSLSCWKWAFLLLWAPLWWQLAKWAASFL